VDCLFEETDVYIRQHQFHLTTIVIFCQKGRSAMTAAAVQIRPSRATPLLRGGVDSGCHPANSSLRRPNSGARIAAPEYVAELMKQNTKGMRKRGSTAVLNPNHVAEKQRSKKASGYH